MIEIAQTQEVFEECVEFLSKRGIFPIKGTSLFFARTGKEIKAVAGYNPSTGGTIDPFFCEDAHHVIALYNFMKGFLIGRGYTCIQVFSNNEKVNQRLMNEEGFKVWQSQIKGLIHEL